MRGREVEAAGQDFHQFFAVIGNTSARAAQSERGPDDDREADFAGELNAIFQIVDERRFRHIESDALHSVFEKQAVFSFLDGADLSADQTYVVLVEHAGVSQFNGEIERGLAADGRQKGKTSVGRHLALDANDLLEILAG